MGKIYDTFNNNVYKNEAEVNQNFIIPLLCNYLGYSRKEIIPEKYYPSKDIFFGRRKIGVTKDIPKGQKPDYITCIENIENPKFVIESKDPKEDLDDHLKQLISYTLGVGVNLLIITNGNSVRIYDVNHIIFKSDNIEELDRKFFVIKNLLSRENQRDKSFFDLIKNIDFEVSLDLKIEQVPNKEKKLIELKLSDFKEYLLNIKAKYENWQMPKEANPFIEKIKKYPPDRLHRFKQYEPYTSKFADDRLYTFNEIDKKFNSPIKIIIGPSGIGKSTLLRYYTYLKAIECINLNSTIIPVYIPLKNISNNNSLYDLIYNSLIKSGYESELELFQILLKYNFIFLLDALDEVQDKYLEDVKKEIEELNDFDKHRIIITSRANTQFGPYTNFPRSIVFKVEELHDEEIRNICEVYLKDDSHRFLNEVSRNNLLEESKNTLLLTLLIILFTQNIDMPRSKVQIIKEIVNNIKIWENSKGPRFSYNIKWEIKEIILNELAYKIIEYRTTNLTSKQIDEVIVPLINIFEEKKMITGVDKYKIIEDLVSTGIILFDNDTLIFWHRIFLYYFASKALANRFLEDHTIIEELKDKLDWEPVIINTVVHQDDSTDYINIIKNSNILLASICMIEANSVNESTINQIISLLIKRCYSEIKIIRQRAINILKRCDEKYTNGKYYNIFETNKYPDIKKICIEEIAKERTQRARELIYKNIDWNVKGGMGLGSTQGSIAKALSHFNEEDHLKILKIWKKEPDFMTSNDCKQALLYIIRQGKMTEKVKNEILNLYIEYDKDRIVYGKDDQLADILIEINDERHASILIESIAQNSKDGYGFYTDKILASYESSYVLSLLCDNAFNLDNNDNVRTICTSALSQSKGHVPIEVYKKLLSDKCLFVRRNAIKGLDRFLPIEVKDTLLNCLDDDPYIQHITFTILGNKGLLLELANEKFPVDLYYRAYFAFTEQVRKYYLVDLLPKINNIKKICDEGKFQNRESVLIDLAHTYYILGNEVESKKIIDSLIKQNISTDDPSFIALIRTSPIFDTQFSVKIINYALESIDKTENVKGKRSYSTNVLFDAIDSIGTKEVLEILKKLAEKYANDKEIILIERSLRSINQIATLEEEDWYIDFINKHKELKVDELNRAIDGLGNVGSEKSIKMIKLLAIENRSTPEIVERCYANLEDIYVNKGLITDLSEDELFNL